MDLAFHVNGIPAPQGSKKGIVTKIYKHGRPIPVAQVVDDNSEELFIWRGMVIDVAREAMGDLEPFDAVRVDLHFYFPRPQNHYGAHGNLLPSAPVEKVTKPDLDKLVRAVYDAFEGAGVVRSDGAIVESHERKDYGTPGLDVKVEALAVRHQQELAI